MVVFPAYAGMFRFEELMRRLQEGFPRVCGDVPPKSMPGKKALKFSPRMRGCSSWGRDVCGGVLVFPAYAGMFRFISLTMILVICFPRVCGDVPSRGFHPKLWRVFSPRMRGCSGSVHATPRHHHVFPAYAGMFRVFHAHLMPSKGFPRVCGDVPTVGNSIPRGHEFSPRMRGCSGVV